MRLVQVIDLQAQQRVAAYDYSASLPDASICTGTHALVYSTRNKQCDSLRPGTQFCSGRRCMQQTRSFHDEPCDEATAARDAR